MQPTSFRQLSLWLLVTLVFGLGISQFLTSTGNPFPLSPTSLSLSLAAIAVGVYLASLPIAGYRRAREKGEQTKRPNSFYAVRVLVFARASELAGAGFLGWHLGQLAWLGIFGSWVQALAIGTALSALASALLLIAGFLAELNCRAPKDSDGEVDS